MQSESASGRIGNNGQTMQDLVDGTRLFRRFTIHKLLGRGRMGTVWLAHDDRVEHLVALRLLPEAICIDPSAREALKRDTLQSRVLRHPNIVRFYDFVEDERSAGISMEFVDGETLSSLRLHKRAQCFAVSEIAPWVASLCDALAYAHDSAGLIHHDLKPANLMVNSRLEIKITDFGIASRPVTGTPNYMSPQQARGEPPTAADDIYAVGATLYEMLSSRPPFLGDDVATQLHKVVPPWVTERREKLGIAGEAVPKYWEETIAACLAKNPADRPQTPVELARRLRLGGTIRLVAAQQESKVRALIHALTQARMVGAAAGVAALIVAVILVLRASPSTVSKVQQAANAAVSDSYAMELLRSDPPPAKTTIVPDSSSAATGAPAPLVPATSPSASLQLTTTPPGASFAVYPGVVAGNAVPATPPLRAGATPEAIGDLPPGHYTLCFRREGWPEGCVEISPEEGEILPVEYTFPHGSASITSAPEGAEIFFGSRSLGHAPLTVDLPLGKQQLIARHPKRPERSRMVTIEKDAPITIAFQLRTQSGSSARTKRKAPESALGRIGQSLKNAFSRKPPPKRSKG